MANMGIGALGAPNIILKRKFRFLATFSPPGGQSDNPETTFTSYVKVASRPQLDIDETELHFLNAIQYIPGKGRWQPLTVTYVDVADEKLRPLYSWILNVYDFNKTIGEANASGSGNLPQSEKAGWAGSGKIEMLDGCGTILERWSFEDVWPQSVNFGDLDYQSSEEATIDVTWRFSRAKIEGVECMPTPQGQCLGCSTNPPGDLTINTANGPASGDPFGGTV